MNIKIKDLKWDYNSAFERAAAPGANCYYIVSKDEYSEYDASCLLTEEEVKYVTIYLGHRSNYEDACEACNKHHKERVEFLYLEAHE